jgi:VanZ family protein
VAWLLKYWLPALGWMAIIFYMSSLQHPAPGDLALIPDWISHPVVYAILALLLCRALAAGKPLTLGAALLAVVFATLYGVSDEWHQSFVPLRDSSALDVVKDFAGAVLGAGAYVRLGPSRKRRAG